MKKFLAILSLCCASIAFSAKEASEKSATPNCKCPPAPSSAPDRGPKRSHEPASTPPATSTPCVCPSSAPSHGK